MSNLQGLALLRTRAAACRPEVGHGMVGVMTDVAVASQRWSKWHWWWQLVRGHERPGQKLQGWIRDASGVLVLEAAVVAG